MNEVRVAFVPIVRPLFRGASMGLWEENLKMLETCKDKKEEVFAGEVIDRSDGFDGMFDWISKLRWASQPLLASSLLANILHHRLPHHLTWGRDDHEQAILECCYWMGYQSLEADPQAENGLVSWPA